MPTNQIRPYAFLGLFFLFLGIFGDIMEFYFHYSDFVLYVLCYPLLEELFKFYISRRYKLIAFKLIVYFAVFEFILVKIPIICSSSSDNFILVFFASIPAIIFHASTAYVYTSNVSKNWSIYCLFIMIFTHSLFNLVPDLPLDVVYSIGCSLTLAFSPLLWISLYRSYDRRELR